MSDPNCRLCQISGPIGCRNHPRSKEEAVFNDLVNQMDDDDLHAKRERWEKYKEEHPRHRRCGTFMSGLDHDEIGEWGPPEF